MNEDQENYLEENPQIAYGDLVDMVLGFQRQLESLDYRVTNKNFGSKIYQAKETIASKGRFVAGAEDDVVIMDGQHPVYRLWAGAKDPADAPFSVDKDGNMVATSLDLSDYLQVGDAADDINNGIDTISGTKITSNSIQTSKLVAGEIVGFTVTGGTVRTSSGSTRVQLSGSDNQIQIYSSGVLRSIGYDQGWSYYNSSGQSVADIYAGTSTLSGSRTLLLAATAATSSSVQLAAGSSGYITMAVGSNNYFYASGSLGYLVAARDIVPTSGRSLGGLGNEWESVYVNNLNVFEDTYFESGVDIVLQGGDLSLLDGGIEIFGSSNHITISGNGFLRLATMSGTTADGLSGAQNGCMYYRTGSNDIRVRINGAWRSVNVT